MKCLLGHVKKSSFILLFLFIEWNFKNVYYVFTSAKAAKIGSTFSGTRWTLEFGVKIMN